MQKLNRVQKHLISFGYPMSVVRAYNTRTKWYREEVKDYVASKKIQGNRQECRVSDD